MNNELRGFGQLAALPKMAESQRNGCVRILFSRSILDKLLPSPDIAVGLNEVTTLAQRSVMSSRAVLPQNITELLAGLSAEATEEEPDPGNRFNKNAAGGPCRAYVR